MCGWVWKGAKGYQSMRNEVEWVVMEQCVVELLRGYLNV